MIINIKTVGFGLTQGLQHHVTDRLATSIGRLRKHIREVIVRLSDLNGPRGGLDKQCQLMLRIDGAPPIVVSDMEQDLYVAFDRAAVRARRTLVRQLRLSSHYPDRRSASGERT